MREKRTIYISGALAFDRIMNFPGRFLDHILPDKMHMLSVRFLIDKLSEARGGPAGNIAHGLALLGEKPYILACVGKDFAPYAKYLQTLDLPMQGIKILPDQVTAGAYITSDLDGNQITCFHPGATDFPAEHSLVRSTNSLIIVSPGNMDDMTMLPGLCRANGLEFIADPGQATTSMSAADLLTMISGANILVSNEYELELIMNITGLETAALLGHCHALVTTLGPGGAKISRVGETIMVKAAQAENLDPTGAGDAFRAGLIKGLVIGFDLERSAMLGAVAAAFCVERHGPQAYSFTKSEFWDRAYQAFRLTPSTDN